MRNILLKQFIRGHPHPGAVEQADKGSGNNILLSLCLKYFRFLNNICFFKVLSIINSAPFIHLKKATV